MKFEDIEVGDEVIVKDFGEMQRENHTTENEFPVDGVFFISSMRALCNKKVSIKEKVSEGSDKYFRIHEEGYMWTAGMFAAKVVSLPDIDSECEKMDISALFKEGVY